MDWFASLSASAHSNLAATLAATAATLLVVTLLPFIRPHEGTDPGGRHSSQLAEDRTRVDLNSVNSRWFSIRFLVLSFALLVVAAVEWGVLAGYQHVEASIPQSCLSTNALPECAGERILQVGYSTGTALLTTGALCLLAALAELVLLTVDGAHTHSHNNSDPCVTFRSARFVRHMYAILLSLAVWEIAYGVSMNLESISDTRSQLLDTWIPLAAGALCWVVFVSVSKHQTYGVSKECPSRVNPSIPESALAAQRRYTIGIALTAFVAVLALNATPMAPLCTASSVAQAPPAPVRG